MRIPLQDFFKNPEQTGFKIAPDGMHISWLSGYKDRMNIFVKNVASGAIRQLTFQTNRDISTYLWLNNTQLAFLQDNNGDENHHVFAVELADGATRDLTPFENVKVDIIDELEDDEAHILIMMNRRNPQLFDVFKLNTIDGTLILLEENPGTITGWVTDHKGDIRIAITTDGVNSSLLYRDVISEPFKPIVTTNFREGISPLFFDFENKYFYALSNIGRDKIAIVLFDPVAVKELEILFEHNAVDADNLGYSKKRKVITSAAYTTDKKHYTFFDKTSEQRYERVKSLIQEDAEIYFTDKDKNESFFIIRTLSDVSLGNYYLYDANLDTITHLANVSPWLNSEALCHMEPIQYTSRDGLTINGYLTLPNNNSSQPYPLIVNPHGGPWARDTWHFNPEVQFLANRGYAVLQINFRGSTGYGKQFLEAAFKQWGKTMQNDITDGVQYLIEKGIADKNKIGIYGASYGGYATLAGLTFTPDLYACGVDYVGVSSLFTFMSSIPPYWEPYLEMMYEMVGHPENDKALLASSSPLLHIDKIKAPLFVAQGALDPRVKKSESDQIVEALRAKNIDVDYMVKDNEGHGFSNQENRFEFYAAMETFLSKHLLNDSQS